jgi:energy-converting hydrogenase Eha subunit C
MSDPATIITGAQAVADISPYINGIVGTIVSAGVTMIAIAAKKYLDVTFSQAALNTVKSLATQYAAKEVFKAEDNLAHATLDTHSALVKTIADQIALDAPKELAALGLTPDDVKDKVAAAFGELQAHMTATPAVQSTAQAAPSAPK